MISLKLLQTFKTSVECGSFTLAAKLLNYTPSTISKHLDELEREVGGPLIVEGSLSKGLTPVGEATYYYAIESLAHFNEFSQKIHSVKEKNVTIRIGGIERYLSEWVIAKVVEYQNQHDDYRFEVVHRTSDETTDQLKDHSLDMGIIADRFVPPSFESVILDRESLVLIASDKTVDYLNRSGSQFESLPILVDKNSSVIADYALKDSHAYPNIVHVEGDTMLCEGARTGLCLGITSDGSFAPDEFHILKVYNEQAPVRLIFPSSIHEDKLKENFLQSFIRHLETEKTME